MGEKIVSTANGKRELSPINSGKRSISYLKQSKLVIKWTLETQSIYGA